MMFVRLSLDDFLLRMLDDGFSQSEGKINAEDGNSISYTLVTALSTRTHSCQWIVVASDL